MYMTRYDEVRKVREESGKRGNGRGGEVCVEVDGLPSLCCLLSWRDGAEDDEVLGLVLLPA